MKNARAICLTPSASAIGRASTLGFVLSIMTKCQSEMGYCLDDFHKLILPAIAHDSLRVIFSSRGEPVAFYIWAGLASDIEERFFKGEVPQLHLSEWNEGSSIWILHIAAPLGHLWTIKSQIAKDLIDYSSLRYGRFRRGKFTCREVEIRR